MRQYFTFRPIVLNTTYTPKYAFDHELNTIIGLDYNFVCQKQGDNRQLGYFEYSGQEDFAIILEIIEETLAKYSYHVKTVEKAKDFIIYCFGDNIESIEIIGDKVDFILKNR